MYALWKNFNSDSGAWTKESTNSTQRAYFKFNSSDDCSESDMDCDVPFSFNSDSSNTVDMNK